MNKRARDLINRREVECPCIFCTKRFDVGFSPHVSLGFLSLISQPGLVNSRSNLAYLGYLKSDHTEISHQSATQCAFSIASERRLCCNYKV